MWVLHTQRQRPALGLSEWPTHPRKKVDFNCKVKMLNNSCDTGEQIWNPVTLHEIIQHDLHVQISSWQGKVLLQENISSQVVVSLTDFNKHFNAPMVIFIRNFFVLQTVKLKASLIWHCVIRAGDDRQFSCPSRSNHSGLLCHLAIFSTEEAGNFGGQWKIAVCGGNGSYCLQTYSVSSAQTLQRIHTCGSPPD